MGVHCNMDVYVHHHSIQCHRIILSPPPPLSFVYGTAVVLVLVLSWRCMHLIIALFVRRSHGGGNGVLSLSPTLVPGTVGSMVHVSILLNIGVM